MRLLLLALRNLTRNKRRTLLTALAIIFGATAKMCIRDSYHPRVAGESKNVKGSMAAGRKMLLTILRHSTQR